MMAPGGFQAIVPARDEEFAIGPPDLPQMMISGPSGKGGALQRRPPLRTVLAGCLAHGSSKPLGQGGLQSRCCAPALACLEGAVAGGVYQGCGNRGVPRAILPGWSGLAGCGLDFPAGDAHPPVLPLLRGTGQVAGVDQGVAA